MSLRRTKLVISKAWMESKFGLGQVTSATMRGQDSESRSASPVDHEQNSARQTHRSKKLLMRRKWKDIWMYFCELAVRT